MSAVTEGEVLGESATADEDGFVLWVDADGAGEIVADESGHGRDSECAAPDERRMDEGLRRAGNGLEDALHGAEADAVARGGAVTCAEDTVCAHGEDVGCDIFGDAIVASCDYG